MKTSEIYRKALVAIVARINCEWDNPELEAFGIVSPGTLNDCETIASRALTDGGEIDYQKIKKGYSFVTPP